jgi:aminoglycoside 2'-N-acetyltransferase I
LWDEAFAGSFSDDDADHAFGGVHALVLEGGELVSHAAVVPRALVVGDRPVQAGYVEAVATVPAYQRRGLGSLAMTALHEVLDSDFDLGALSTSAHDFYARLGWERWRGPSFVVREGTRLRTAEEDDGLMVRRTARTRWVTLTEPLACHDRPGDGW